MSLEVKLAKREENGNLRALGRPQELIDFTSNDYLGLARSEELHLLAMQEWQKLKDKGHFLGSTGSRLLSGNHAYFEELETEISTFHSFEAGLLFSCGYLANLGLLSSLEDTIIHDISVHASTYDGMRLSKARITPFRHNDMHHLEVRLKNAPKGKIFVCVESVYSTDGSFAPLEDIVCLCNKYGALLIVDEAHAVGLFGSHGQGLTYEKNLTSHVFAQVTTFGKAPGIQGAIILGSHKLKQYLINFARPFIYTTAPSLPFLASIKVSYSLFPKMHHERKHFFSLCQSPIQAFMCSGNEEAKSLAKMLKTEGMDVRPLLSPTVPKGKERLRICLHAFNTHEEVAKLKKILGL